MLQNSLLWCGSTSVEFILALYVLIYDVLFIKDVVSYKKMLM